MPTYDYRCNSCRHAWEVEQRMSDDDLTKCPKCKKNTAEKQISTGSGFILKGAGWYKDLYHKPSSPPPGDAEASTSTASDSVSETATAASKPASKSETKKSSGSKKAKS